MRVCLINDSFPPIVDGVANVTYNYASILEAEYGGAVVVTPEYPGVKDDYPFPVIRFPSVNTEKIVGYRTGNPFSVKTICRVSDMNVDLLHAHCPVSSMALGRILKDALSLPLVFTYHTKFDIEIKKALKLGFLMDAGKKMLCENISFADEVWAVSKGAAENLRGIGYEGECIVMPNGVDMPRGRVPDGEIKELAARHAIAPDTPVFLFAGRLMWYKGIRILLDALSMVKAQGKRFFMIFAGDGMDRAEIEAYAREKGLEKECAFIGMQRNRDVLRAYFCLAELMLFPSTFDTNGLVVREAAACALPSVLVKGSCAAEDATDGVNALTAEENAASYADVILRYMYDRPALEKIGQNAMRDLYLSWRDAVMLANGRYEALAEKKRAGLLPARASKINLLYDTTAELAEIQFRANRESASTAAGADAIYEEIRRQFAHGKTRLRAGEYYLSRKMRRFKKRRKP